MGGEGKRKRGGGREGRPTNSRMRKTKTAAAATPTRKEDSPPNSDIDEPQVEDIGDHQDLFDDPSNQDLAPADPGIDIDAVILMRPPKVEPMVEDEHQDQMNFNTISVAETPSIDLKANNGGSGHASPSPSTSTPSKGMLSPTECKNGIRPTRVTTGDGNNEATSNCFADSNGSPLTNEMSGKREGTVRTVDEDEDDTTASTIRNQRHTEGIIAAAKAQEMLPRSGGVNVKVLKEGMEEARGETATLKRELHTTNVDLERQTSRAEILKEEQRKLALENSITIDRLTGELDKQSEMLTNTISKKNGVIQSKTAEIGDLKEVIRQFVTKKERLTNPVISKLACENTRLQDDNADLRRPIAGKDEVIQKQAGNIEGLQKDLKILWDDSTGRLNELDEARQLEDEKSKLFRKQLEEANRKIYVLENSILGKDNELA